MGTVLLKDDTLQYNKNRGDLIIPSDSRISLSFYLRAEYYSKAVNYFVQHEEYDIIVPTLAVLAR